MQQDSVYFQEKKLENCVIRPKIPFFKIGAITCDINLTTSKKTIF